MNNAGFYKKDETQILFAPNIVEGPGYTILISEKDTYSYPVDGWIYATSLDNAISYFASNSNDQIAPFDVQPENFKLAVSKEDEAEFGKLIVLINLNLQQNKITTSTQITIWDHVKQARSVAVYRFLEIMADYGMYCYSHRI
jgi:hypothetical protein